MKKTFSNLNFYIELAFKTLSAAYFLISFLYFFFFTPAGEGDESLFMNDLNFIKSFGWIAAIQKSISVPYMIFAYPFSFIFPNHIALRLVSLLLAFFLFFYFFKVAKIKSAIFYFYFLFYVATSSFFFKGTNDILFFTGLILFMTEIFFFIDQGKMNNQALAFSGLMVSFFTRELFVVYLPVVLLGFYFLYRKNFEFFNRKMLFPLVLFLFLTVSNIPSIIKNGKLSYDDKQPPKEMNVTWTQRQYLAQLMVNKGELQNFKHPSWKVTQDYLQKNGPDSLPKTTFESMTFDYKLTITEFFKDFYYSVFFGFRQLGLILFAIFYYVIVSLIKVRLLRPEMYVPLATVIMLSIFSLIIISYIELRWLIAVFTISIVFYDHCQSQFKLSKVLIVLNYAVLACFSIYGLYKLVPKLAQNLL